MSTTAGPPPTVLEVTRVYDILNKEFPGAEIKASTFDNFTAALYEALPTLKLEVVTGESAAAATAGVAECCILRCAGGNVALSCMAGCR